MGSERGDGHKKPCSLGEGTGTKVPDDSEAPQRATASRPVPTHQSDPPFEDDDKRRFGYSRDHRFDCVQVVIALIVTPEGLPLTYEVLSGNTADATTLPHFLARIEKLYGSARRIWVMDRGIPTEAHLEQMRARGAQYLVGTPKGRLNKLEAALAARAWHAARPEVRVKLLPEDVDLCVYVESQARIGKERSMRRKRFKRYWARLD